MAIKASGTWLQTADTLKEAEAKFKGKQFIIDLSPTHKVRVQVTSVRLYGGVILSYCKVVKTIKADKGDKTQFSSKGEVFYPGTLKSL